MLCQLTFKMKLTTAYNFFHNIYRNYTIKIPPQIHLFCSHLFFLAHLSASKKESFLVNVSARTKLKYSSNINLLTGDLLGLEFFKLHLKWKHNWDIIYMKKVYKTDIVTADSLNILQNNFIISKARPALNIPQRAEAAYKLKRYLAWLHLSFLLQKISEYDALVQAQINTSFHDPKVIKPFP